MLIMWILTWLSSGVLVGSLLSFIKWAAGYELTIDDHLNHLGKAWIVGGTLIILYNIIF